MREGKTLLFLFCSWLSLVLPLRSCHAQTETKTFVAYSMKVAQTRLEEATKSNEDFRKKAPDLFYLGGITKPWAVVLDANSGDWILVGERDPECSVLTLDDWVVALRSRFIHPEEDPGVTINPRPCDKCIEEGKSKSCRHSSTQKVRFFGGVEDTEFGQTCFEADWLMKKVALGLERLPIENLKTYYDLSVEQARVRRAGGSRTSSRFWFYPIMNRVNVFPDVVLLERFQMGVFTEVLYAEVDGKPVDDLEKREHYPSEKFSRSLSENYDAAAQARPVLEALRGLTRLAALAKGLTQVDSRPTLGFYLSEYSPNRKNTINDVEVLKVTHQGVGVEISGGVDLMALTVNLKGGDAGALKQLILAARSAAGSETLTWGLQLHVEDEKLSCVRIDPLGEDTIGLASLFAHACFLSTRKRYGEAIELFNEIIDRCPPLRPECLYRKGDALGALGQHEDALLCFDAGLELDPQDIFLWNGKGNVLDAMSRHEDALRCYDRALEVDRLSSQAFLAWYNKGSSLYHLRRNSEAIEALEYAIALVPRFSEAWHSKGAILMNEGSHADALECFNKAISLAPSDPHAWNSQGITLRHMGRLDEALACHDKALALDPQYARAWSDKAAALAYDGEYAEALQCSVKATAIDPNSAYAWLNKGAVLADMKRFQEALECFDRSLNIAPRYETALSNKGVVLGQLDRHHEALRCFDRALELSPKSGHAWFNKARLLEERGSFEEAATLYRGLLKASLKEHSLEEWTARTLDRIRAIGQSTIDGNNKRDKE